MSKVHNKTKKSKNDYKLSSSKISSTKKKSIRYSKSRSEVSDMITKFEGINIWYLDLFIKEENFTTKKIKEFSKESFSYKSSSTSETQIEYSNLIYFILKLSGVEFDQKNFKNLNENNCSDENTIEEIINNSKVKKYKKIKVSKLYIIFEAVSEEIYNKYR